MGRAPGLGELRAVPVPVSQCAVDAVHVLAAPALRVRVEVVEALAGGVVQPRLPGEPVPAHGLRAKHFGGAAFGTPAFQFELP